jgi:branched-chain amino acid transport system permease protein
VKVFQAITIYSIVAAGLVILYGRVGMISLCQIALLGVGGWVSLRLAFATGMPFPLLLLATGLITGLIGVAVGLPALRLSGLHLALITLMAAGAITLILNRLNFPNGGGGFRGIAAGFASTRQMPRPEIASGDSAYLRYCVVVAVILFVLAFWHLHSRAGRAWSAIRQSEAAAVAAGVNVTVYKLWAFALASFMAGVAGGLLAASVGQLSYLQFPTQDSIILLTAVLIGGVHSLAGAVVAGIFMRGIPAVLDTIGATSNLTLVLFGLGVFQVLATAPRGIYGQLEDAAAALRRRRFAARRADR